MPCEGDCPPPRTLALTIEVNGTQEAQRGRAATKGEATKGTKGTKRFAWFLFVPFVPFVAFLKSLSNRREFTG